MQTNNPAHASHIINFQINTKHNKKIWQIEVKKINEPAIQIMQLTCADARPISSITLQSSLFLNLELDKHTYETNISETQDPSYQFSYVLSINSSQSQQSLNVNDLFLCLLDKNDAENTSTDIWYYPCPVPSISRQSCT